MNIQERCLRHCCVRYCQQF